MADGGGATATIAGSVRTSNGVFRPWLEPSGGPVTRLAVREAGRVYFVPVAAIDWVEAADYYVKLHVGARVHMLRETLVSLERRLDATRFFRIHRSAIVNLSRVREIRLSNKGDHLVTLEDNTRLRTTRARRWELEQLMEHVAP